MTSFGEALRTLRQQSHDPDRQSRRLSQGRLGELIGHEMQDGGFSGAAVSDWERGKSRIDADQRRVLIALIQVLHKCEGIKTLEVANRLLESGNFRSLNNNEATKIFGQIPIEESVERPASELGGSKSVTSFLLQRFFFLSKDEAEALVVSAGNGPSPLWPRLLAAFMRKGSEWISITPKNILWIWVWLLAWWLVGPSLRWPFTDRDAVLRAVGMYVAGTLVIPLLIGLLVDTRNSEYWKGHGLAQSKLLRLYTHQGAGIGFNLGYFFIFPFVLIRYYLGFGASVWLEVVAVTLGLVLGNMSARVVPHNLWRAYNRLHLADGAIFFVVVLLGPLWGLFFLEFYPVLLTPLLGSMVILLAFTLFVVIAMRQSRKKLAANKQA